MWTMDQVLIPRVRVLTSVANLAPLLLNKNHHPYKISV